MIIIDAVTVTIVNFVALLSARSRLGAILIALRLAAWDKLAINKHSTETRNEKREMRKEKGEQGERRKSISVQRLIGFAKAESVSRG